MVSRRETKKQEKAKKDEPAVSYIQIFRYGTCFERFATMVGALLALMSGGGICFILAQFGEMNSAMVERTTYQDQLSSRMPLLEAFGGGRRLMNASHEENMVALVEDATAAVAGMFTSVAVAQALLMAAVALINWSALKQITRIRQLFLQAVLRQDMTWFDTDTEFNLAAKMTENMKQLKEGMGEKLAVVSNLAGTAILSVCTALPLGWKLALACLTVVPFSITASVLLSNYQTRSSIRETESYSQAGKQAEEVLKSVRTVVAFGGQSKEVEKYKGLLAPAERFGRERGVYTGVGTGISWLLTYSLNTIGLAYGTRLVLDDLSKPVDERIYQVGSIFAILYTIYTATQSITFCVPHGEAFAAARAAASNIFQLLENEPSIDSMSKAGSCPKRVLGDITFEDVHFSYPARPNVKVLQGFSIHVKRGECVALVGSSGCGKSTILQLLQRLYDPLAGSVKIDGKNIKNLKISWLRSILGVVGQEPVLFRGTIYQNIAICCPEATREEVEAAATMAYAHEFIMNLAAGYDTVIGERGTSLSGGQKQRIAIARALLREPAILLLDEATSALDPHSERQVQAALDRAREGRTTLVVSHRLSTIVNADRIICMDKGVIVEQGTHQELMKCKGMYYNLVISSHGGEEPDLIETFPEETENETKDYETRLPSRLEVKRKSNRRINRRHSVKRDSHDWMTPRGSISSVVSTGLQSFAYSADSDEEEENEDAGEDLKSVGAWQLIKVNAPEWHLLTVGSIAAVAQGVCFPAFALLMGYSAGIFALSDQREIVNLADFYSGMFMVVAAVAGVSMCLQSTAFTNSGLKLTTRLRYQYFDSLLRQEIGYFDKESNTVGAMCARLSGDAAEVQGATGLMIGLMLQGLSSVLVGFIMALCYNWKLALVGASFVPIMVGCTWLEGEISQKSQADERAAVEEATAVATEAVISLRTVQSLGIENVFLEKFQAALKESCVAITKKNRWRGFVLGLGIYMPFVAYTSVLSYGATLVAYEDLEYKTALLVTEATMYGAYALGQSLVYAPSLNSAKTCGARILAVIRRQPKITSEPGLKDTIDWMASGNFSIKDVEFSYPTRPHRRVLRGIDLKVEAGKTVALVGSSGCGKSTILQLLQRFYDPDSGNIELDSRDIRSALTIPRLRRQLGVVQQEPVLFDRTLAENIAYGDNLRKVPMYEIVNAAKAANIHNFIMSLPKGYETNLGSCGAQLSGGQKQRVCIARALVRTPRLLLLDEATSALDASSERAVAEALEKAAKGRTCVTVAHRLCTIKDSDLICVLDKGNIVERGTHTELVEMRGLYWKMCKGQNMA